MILSVGALYLDVDGYVLFTMKQHPSYTIERYVNLFQFWLKTTHNCFSNIDVCLTAVVIFLLGLNNTGSGNGVSNGNNNLGDDNGMDNGNENVGNGNGIDNGNDNIGSKNGIVNGNENNGNENGAGNGKTISLSITLFLQRKN